jgi:hypothetical protein
MSRIGDHLYFAPGVRFSQLDLSGLRLPTQFKQRIAGFYLKPAISVAAENAFAAGLLVTCAIDALAFYNTGSMSVSGRIIAYCKKIPDLAVGENAELFCDKFRHGLVHEARVKDGSEFSTELQQTSLRDGDRLIVNPVRLANDLMPVLDAFIDELYHDLKRTAAFRRKIKRTFSFELDN